MTSMIRKGCVFLAVALISMPLLADDKHKDWINLDSVSWGQHQQGGATRLADGMYKTEKGQYLVVEAGRVTAKGPDYRRFKPSGTRVRAPDNDEEAGLLLPAVQKVRGAAAKSESNKPGIEPDEIDAQAPSARAGGYMKLGDIKGESQAAGANKPGGGMTGQSRRRGAATVEDASAAKELDKASPKLQEASVGGRRYSVQQMMAKLRPRSSNLVMTSSGGSTGPADKVAAPPTDSKYEIAECGTPSSPMICCHHEAGDGSTCNMFKMLCENAGGTAQGDQTDATCSDWP